MNYKIIILLFSIFLLSCVEELNIADFADDYAGYDRELRIEAVMLPHENNAIIRIDQSILITDESLFNCEDENNNWIGSGCVCGEYGGFSFEGCPENQVQCDAISGEWLETLVGFNVCILNDLTEEQCVDNQDYNFSWQLINDCGSDGICPTGDNKEEEEGYEHTPDEDGTEGNGEPDCGEPNVDDLEEITEYSDDIHVTDCDTVKMTFNYSDFECNFVWSDEAGSMYNSSGIIGFSNGTACETGNEIVLTQQDLDDLSYSYGAWIPDSQCNNFNNESDDGLGFFEQRSNEISYNLHIDCNDQTITNSNPEIIPYPVVFVNKSAITEEEIGSCVVGTEEEINDCLIDDMNGFELDGLQNFEIQYDDNYDDNVLNYVATSIWYQAVQYNDPFDNSCSNLSEDDDTWYYYHGHPALAYPPSENTNHFPAYPATPVIYSNEEIIVSKSPFDAGCYRYEISTFSDGYQKYYLSQLDLKDPERSNLRRDGEVVIGSFGSMNTKAIDFIIE